MRILVDTNVFLDFFLQRDIKGLEAKEFFINCKKGKHQIYVTSMSIRDIGYVAHRYLKDNSKTRQIQLATYEMCSKIVGISSDCAIESIYSEIRDFEDSLIIEAAKESLSDLIITSNIEDFENSHFLVWTPKEFNEVVNREN